MTVSPTRLNEDGEMEKLCGICQEWWPADDEFFSRNSVSGKVVSPCKACVIELRREIAKKPCKYAGCPNPRYGRATSYCRNHYYEIVLKIPAPKKPHRRLVRHADN